jgi:hypothetical protein
MVIYSHYLILFDDMKSKNVVIIGILILFLVFVLNESRFIIWGPFGVPEQPSRPNCGETRYQYDVKINSKQEFLNLIESWKNVTSGQVGQEAFSVIKWFKGGQYNLDDVNVRESGSLLFSQKLYSVNLKSDESWPCSMILEISENGYASSRGCCGI